MSALKTNGICTTCNESIAKRSALKHVDSCFLANNDTKSKENRTFVIRVNDGPGIFWIYIAVPVTDTLEDLDWYIKKLWLECCGHMSMFEIGENCYNAYPEPGHGDKSMDVPLNKVFEPGATAKYEYDFGTPTELVFEVVREYSSKTKDDSIKLLMRNEMPKVMCQACEDQAAFICSYCQMPSCKKCRKKDECGDMDSFLPFVNSPRTGQCGYGG